MAASPLFLRRRGEQQVEPMRLAELIEEDVCLAALYLQFREKLFPEILKASKFDSRRQLDSAKYELANIYSRFYMCARNEEVPLVDVFEKMRTELLEKKFVVPDSILEVDVRKKFALTSEARSSLFDVYRQMQFEEQACSATWSYIRPDLVEHCAKLSITVSKEKLLSLKERCSRFLVQRKDVGTTSLVDAVTTDMLLAVTAFSYMVASGSLYWGFGPDAYNFVKDMLSGEIELYASPFNHTLEHFCSPFELDKVYGSLGSFYRVDWNAVFSQGRFAKIKNSEDRIAVIANPPYIESEIGLCFKNIESLLQDHAAKVSMVLSICPAWEGASGILGLQSSRFKVYEKRLLPCEHSYYNYQTFKWIAAQFPSLGFAFHADCQDETFIADRRAQAAASVEKVFAKLQEDSQGLQAAKRRKTKR